MENHDVLYPVLPKYDVVDGENFRLHKIDKLLNKLDAEEKHYSGVRKKYSRSRSVFHKTAVISGLIGAALASSSIGTSATGIGAAVGIPLGALAGALSLISAGSGIMSKRLTKKICKHDKTIQLIKSKKSSISDLVSKALTDNHVSEHEFSTILSEIDKYNKLKASIRLKKNKAFLKNNQEIPHIDIKRMREEMKNDIIKQLMVVNPDQKK